MEAIHVLLIEDNPADADLALETLSSSRLHIETAVVTDGAKAIEFLHRRGEYAGAARPDLILLDLDLPKLSGKQVLSDLKRDAELRKVPVVVLTSSSADRDILENYDLGANCYVTKPVDLKAFQTIVTSIEGFWFTVVRLPTKVK
jgi:CheY-like chemotaxis protein